MDSELRAFTMLYKLQEDSVTFKNQGVLIFNPINCIYLITMINNNNERFQNISQHN